MQSESHISSSLDAATAAGGAAAWVSPFLRLSFIADLVYKSFVREKFKNESDKLSLRALDANLS